MSTWSPFSRPSAGSITASVSDYQSDQAETIESPDDLSHKTWMLYEELFKATDTTFIKTWDDDLNTLLLFATLFSAVVTAFVLDSYKSLNPSGDSETFIVLQKLLATNRSRLDNLHELLPLLLDTRSSSNAVQVNTLWFASLVTSVSTAFLAILSKEWLADLSSGCKDPHISTRGRQLQLRYENMQGWKLSQVLPFLPILLHVSFLLFFAGLIDFLWHINGTVATVATVLIGAMTFAYCWTHFISVFSASCPYRTSFSSLILFTIYSAWTAVVWHIPASLAKLWVMFAVIKKTRREDFELFESVWDVIVLSWIRGIWRGVRIPASRHINVLPAARGRLPPGITRPGPSDIIRLREEAYIEQNKDLMNGHALARIISMLPQRQESIQLALQELAHFPGLVELRSLFIDSGAVGRLVRYTLQLPRPWSPADMPVISMMLWSLARLLTEADTSMTDDARTYTFIVAGVPVPWDIRLQRLPSYIPYHYHPEESLVQLGLHKLDNLRVSASSIVLFSYALRLRLVRAGPWSTHGESDNSDELRRDLGSSVNSFHEALLNRDVLAGLSDIDLISLVNTIVYISMNVEKIEDAGQGNAYDEHTLKSLNVFITMMVKRQDMGLSVLRQICWSIWMLSMPTSQSLAGLLIPVVRSTDNLAPALADLLGFRSMIWLKYLGTLGHRRTPRACPVLMPFRCATLTLLCHLLQREADENRSRLRGAYGQSSCSSIAEQHDANSLRKTLWDRHIYIMHHGDYLQPELSSRCHTVDFSPSSPTLDEWILVTRRAIRICTVAMEIGHQQSVNSQSDSALDVNSVLCATAKLLTKLSDEVWNRRQNRDSMGASEYKFTSFHILLVYFTAWVILARQPQHDSQVAEGRPRLEPFDNAVSAFIDDPPDEPELPIYCADPQLLVDTVDRSVHAAFDQVCRNGSPQAAGVADDVTPSNGRSKDELLLRSTIRAFFACLENLLREDRLHHLIKDAVALRLHPTINLISKVQGYIVATNLDNTRHPIKLVEAVSSWASQANGGETPLTHGQ